jgi:hypothetical protein
MCPRVDRFQTRKLRIKQKISVKSLFMELFCECKGLVNFVIDLVFLFYFILCGVFPLLLNERDQILVCFMSLQYAEAILFLKACLFFFHWLVGTV